MMGIAHMHKRNIAHLDLKIDNIHVNIIDDQI